MSAVLTYPSRARVRELFDYDHRTGEIAWRVDTRKTRKGAPAGSRRKDGSRVVSIDGRLYVASRVVWLYMTGDWPRQRLTFRDRDPSNLAWRNLALESDFYSFSSNAERLRRYGLRRRIFAYVEKHFGRPPRPDEMTPGTPAHDAILRMMAPPVRYRSPAPRARPAPPAIPADPPSSVLPQPAGAPPLTAFRARQFVDYDPDAGTMRWRHTDPRWRTVAGRDATSRRADGSRQIAIEGRRYSANRLAWLLLHGTWPPGRLVYADGDPANIRAANIQLSRGAARRQRKQERAAA